MNRRALLLFVSMSLLWGIPYLFIKIAVDEISPATLVFGRTALAAVILLPIALLRTDLRPVLARWRWVVAFAAVEIAIPWVALGSAEQHISSSLAALLIAGVPLVGAVVALLTRGTDRFGPTALFGMVLGIVGVAFIVGGDFAGTDMTAVLLIGVVVVGYALGPAILSRRLDGLPTVAIMAVSLTLVAIVFVPIAASQWPTVTPSSDVLLAVVVLATVCTAAAFILFGALIESIGPVRATVITYINPGVAAVLGVLVLQESLTVPMLIGFALVIAGSVLATRPAQAQTLDPTPAAA